MDILVIENLNIYYGKKQVLFNVSLSLKKGSILSIVGESGSGKSSILKCIHSIIPPNTHIHAKNLSIFDENIKSAHLKNGSTRKFLGKKIGVVFQEPGSTLNPTIKIGKQIIQMLEYNFKIDNSKCLEIGKKYLSDIHLDADDVWGKYPYELSGGMKQRVSIAMAMMLEPEILIMDEPTSALDATVQKKIMDEIQELHKTKNITILMVTHNLPMACNVSDEIIVLKDGVIVDRGSPYEILNNSNDDYTKNLLRDIPRF